ncbi:hypothetical protein Tco_1220844 [Tanacetum coccineum]
MIPSPTEQRLRDFFLQIHGHAYFHSPSPLILLSPPSTGERFVRSMASPAHSSPLPPSLYIPPPVDHRDDIPESEQPPHKRLCLSTLGSRYEITEAVPEIAPVTVEEVNTRVTKLAELHKHDTQYLYALLEDAQDSRSSVISQSIRNGLLGSLDRIDQATHQELQPIVIMCMHTIPISRHTKHSYSCRARQHNGVYTLRVIRDHDAKLSDMRPIVRTKARAAEERLDSQGQRG